MQEHSPFNRLSGASVLAKDLLFATLDPTMRVIPLPHGRKVILSDTVGFISDLPTSLIAAFRLVLVGRGSSMMFRRRRTRHAGPPDRRGTARRGCCRRVSGPRDAAGS